MFARPDVQRNARRCAGRDGFVTRPFLASQRPARYALSMRIAFAAILALALALSLSCAAAQSPPPAADGGIDWSGEIAVALDLARAVDPAVRAQADADAALTVAQHAAIDHALDGVAASLPALEDAVRAVQAAHGQPTATCALWAALHAAIGARLDVVTLLQGFGLSIPADVAILVGVLGAAADAIIPVCGPSRAALVGREMPRIMAAFARGATGAGAAHPMSED